MTRSSEESCRRCRSSSRGSTLAVATALACSGVCRPIWPSDQAVAARTWSSVSAERVSANCTAPCMGNGGHTFVCTYVCTVPTYVRMHLHIQRGSVLTVWHPAWGMEDIHTHSRYIQYVCMYVCTHLRNCVCFVYNRVKDVRTQARHLLFIYSSL